MLEAVTKDLVFTISLKRSTQKSSAIHKLGRPITPSYGPESNIGGFVKSWHLKARTRYGEGIVQTTNEPNARTRRGEAAKVEVV